MRKDTANVSAVGWVGNGCVRRLYGIIISMVYIAGNKEIIHYV